MRVILQRVSKAHVKVAGDPRPKREIGEGLVVLLGIEELDTKEDIEWLCKKITALRIFSDEQGLMNLSIHEIHGSILLISQFTLHASTKKGNRPSFIKAAKPDLAEPLYNEFIIELKNSGLRIETGEFGANMEVELINSGPVTIIMDSKNKE